MALRTMVEKSKYKTVTFKDQGEPIKEIGPFKKKKVKKEKDRG